MAQSEVKLSCSIEVVSNPPGGRRGIGFLLFPGNRNVTAKDGFDKLSDKESRWVQVAFDYWIGNHPNTKRHHGWNRSEFNGRYTQCYVFKADSNRFYGFLCNPKASDPRFQFCMLVAHGRKHQFATEEGFLQIAEEFRANIPVQRALKLIFPNSS